MEKESVGQKNGTDSERNGQKKEGLCVNSSHLHLLSLDQVVSEQSPQADAVFLG